MVAGDHVRQGEAQGSKFLLSMQSARAGMVDLAGRTVHKVRFISSGASNVLLKCRTVLPKIVPKACQFAPLARAEICGHLTGHGDTADRCSWSG